MAATGGWHFAVAVNRPGQSWIEEHDVDEVFVSVRQLRGRVVRQRPMAFLGALFWLVGLYF